MLALRLHQTVPARVGMRALGVRFNSDSPAEPKPTTEDLAPEVKKELASELKSKYTPAAAPKHIVEAEPAHPPATVATPEEGFAISGANESVKARTAIIYRPTRSPRSRGMAKTQRWMLTFKPESYGWINPLMGYRSGENVLGQVKLKFDTREEAVDFAERQGYNFEVLPDVSQQADSIGELQYYHNFLSPSAEKAMNEGEVRPAKHFGWRRPNQSTWVNLKRTDYGESKWDDHLA